MHLKHMNKWDQEKRNRILMGIAIPIIILSMIRVYSREGFTYWNVFLGLVTIVTLTVSYIRRKSRVRK